MKQITLMTLMLFCLLPSCSQRTQADSPTIARVADNRTAYVNEAIPTYAKFEIMFDVTTQAANPYHPYDASPPPGIAPGQGVTIEALFTPDDWRIVYIQPAFYYQEFLDTIRDGREWFYPTDTFQWMVRFAPHQPGQWQYKIRIQDVGGSAETPPQSFAVTDSNRKGLIRVSPTDPRYFEYDDGTYFPALGYNLNYRQVDWINPVLANQAHFTEMSQNGIQLIRLWLSQWGIFGATGNFWAQHVGLGESGLSFDEAYADGDVALRILGSWNRCIVSGWESAKIPVKRNTDYRIRIRYKTADMGPPLDPDQPHGFVAKLGGWLWGPDYCYEPGTGTILTTHQPTDTPEWQLLEGTFNSGDRDFLDFLYLALENMDQGTVYIDHVWIEEEMGNGQYGPNIIYKPDANYHYYFEQRAAYAFDKVLELAAQNDLYFKLVLLDKMELIENRIDHDGNPVPEPEFNNDFFYGNWRQVTKVRWLQQAFWRYVQARWGYSPHIHSWEVLNEGDPFNSRHYALADEFGKYMHCRVFGIAVGYEDGQHCTYDHPNAHMVSTSTWHSYPWETFWNNSSYPNVDYADIHKYVTEGEDYWTYTGAGYVEDFSAADFYDTALFTQKPSMQFGAQQPYGAGKPLLRGEVGFIFSGVDAFAKNADGGLWLHNFVWGGINPGGLIEAYWASPPTQEHIFSAAHDHRAIFKTYANFIQDIPLSNGLYQDAQVRSAKLRVWGQIDRTHGRAHLWIQNPHHSWKNGAERIAVLPISETFTVTGFLPTTGYRLEWWDTYAGTPTRTETLTSDANGALTITIQALTTDTAVKIALKQSVSTHVRYIPAIRK